MGAERRPGDFLHAFSGWPRGPYPGALDLLDSLRDDYRLALLSNCNAVHWDRLTPFLDRVDSAFSSHLIGLVKPDAAIFHYVADALGVSPDEIVFFDDSPANVDAARAVGIAAHLVRGVEEVERAVRELGK